MRSFADVYPDLIDEWSTENEIKPDSVSYGSSKMVIWNGSCGHTWKASVKNRGNGHGCPYCSGNQVLTGYNDMETHYPELAKEWSDLNLPVLPSEVTVKANKEFWWKCRKCGQQWQARVADRTDGHGCPVCAGEKLIAGINDLAATYPELAAEWSDKNGDLKPTMVWPKSRQNVWWKCGKCGYEYRAVIDSRVKGLKCPVCSDRKVKSGVNDLLFLNPDIAKGWCMERNGELKPDMASPKSRMMVYWKCKNGHIYPKKIADQVADSGCPVCEAYYYDKVPIEAIRHYSDKAGVICRENDEEIIGIPLQFYFPMQKAAIEYYVPRRETVARRRWENAKNWLCLNAGIRLIRIIPTNAKEFDNCICISTDRFDTVYVGEAIRAAFRYAKIDVDVNLGRDNADIFWEFIDRIGRD